MQHWFLIASEIALTLLAVSFGLVGIGWIKNRSDRAQYVVTLSPNDRERLGGFELAGGNWDMFCLMEKESTEAEQERQRIREERAGPRSAFFQLTCRPPDNHQTL